MGSTLCKRPMYLEHFSVPSLSCQNRAIPFTSSTLVWRFSLCQRSSIGFRSGDSASVIHQFMLFDCWTNAVVIEFVFQQVLALKLRVFDSPTIGSLSFFLENALTNFSMMSPGKILTNSLELKYHLILVLKTCAVQSSS